MEWEDLFWCRKFTNFDNNFHSVELQVAMCIATTEQDAIDWKETRLAAVKRDPPKFIFCSKKYKDSDFRQHQCDGDPFGMDA